MTRNGLPGAGRLARQATTTLEAILEVPPDAMGRTGTRKAQEAQERAVGRPLATGMTKTTRKTRRSLRGLRINAPAVVQSLQTILEARAERIPDTRITMAARKLTAGLSRRRE